MDADKDKTIKEPIKTTPTKVVPSPEKKVLAVDKLPPLPGYDPNDKSLPELPEEFLTEEQKAEIKREKELELQKKKEEEMKIKSKKLEKKKREKSLEDRERALDKREQKLEETLEDDSKPSKNEGGGNAVLGFAMGLFRFVFNCRFIGLTFLVLFIGSIVGTIYLIAARPQPIWDGAKDWLNAGLQEHPHNGTTLESASTELEFQLREFGLGENELVITEAQLKPIINERLKDINTGEIHADLQPGELRLYWDVVPGEGSPLWVVLQLETDKAQKPIIENLGTNRIPAPGFLNDLFTKTALAALNITGVSSGSELITVILPLPENVTVSGVQFLDDEMRITLEVTSGLDSVLQF